MELTTKITNRNTVKTLLIVFTVMIAVGDTIGMTSFLANDDSANLYSLIVDNPGKTFASLVVALVVGVLTSNTRFNSRLSITFGVIISAVLTGNTVYLILSEAHAVSESNRLTVEKVRADIIVKRDEELEINNNSIIRHLSSVARKSTGEYYKDWTVGSYTGNCGENLAKSKMDRVGHQAGKCESVKKLRVRNEYIMSDTYIGSVLAKSGATKADKAETLFSLIGTLEDTSIRASVSIGLGFALLGLLVFFRSLMIKAEEAEEAEEDTDGGEAHEGLTDFDLHEPVFDKYKSFPDFEKLDTPIKAIINGGIDNFTSNAPVKLPQLKKWGASLGGLSRLDVERARDILVSGGVLVKSGEGRGARYMFAQRLPVESIKPKLYAVNS